MSEGMKAIAALANKKEPVNMRVIMTVDDIGTEVEAAKYVCAWLSWMQRNGPEEMGKKIICICVDKDPAPKGFPNG